MAPDRSNDDARSDETETGRFEAPELPDVSQPDSRPEADHGEGTSREIREIDLPRVDRAESGDRRPVLDEEDDGGETVFEKRPERSEAAIVPRRPAGGEPVLLRHAEYSIGRSPESSIQLRSKRSSRKHARIFRHGDGWFVAPADRSKVVLVDGRTIRGEKRLSHGNYLTLGGDEFEFLDYGATSGTARTEPEDDEGRGSPESGAEVKPDCGTRIRWAVYLMLAAAALLASAALLITVLLPRGI